METDRNCVIAVKDVWLERDGRLILKDVNLNVCRGDFMAVTGPNGGGKTSLLKLMLKLIPPTRGSVDYNPSNHGSWDGVLNIGYLPQKNMIDSRFPVTVEYVVASGLLGVKGMTAIDKSKRVEEMLSLVELEDYRRQAIGRLSGGQLQRALLGRALAPAPEVLVLDEPLSYLDARFTRRLYDILAMLGRDVTTILVSHEMTEISSMATRHIIVDRSVRECGSAHHCVHYDCQG